MFVGTFSAAPGCGPWDHVLPVKAQDTEPPHVSPLNISNELDHLLNTVEVPLSPRRLEGQDRNHFRDEGQRQAGSGLTGAVPIWNTPVPQ